MEFAPAHGVLTLSYESLLAQPQETLGQLLRHLELPEDKAIIQDMVRRASFEYTTGRPRGTEDARNFYRKGMAGDWVNHLTAADRKLFAERAGHLLVQLGYETSTDDGQWGKTAHSLAGKS
jgi:hypothetical protein